MSLAVFISRFLGLIREQVFAYFFGASLWADAYLVAFRIPNLFRDLFAEGALSSAFVSVFSKQKTLTDSQDLYEKVMSLLWIFVGALTILIFLTSSFWVELLAPQFKNTPEKWSVTLDLVKIFSPFILLVSAASLVMGVLNSKGVFFIPSLGAASFNVGNIVLGGSLAYFFARHSDYRGAILGFGVGTLAGGFLQWSIQWRSLKKEGFSPLGFLFKFLRPQFVWLAFKDKRVRKIFAIMSPSVLTVAAVQVNVMINTLFATSIGTGAVSYLNYAFRILHFPMGLFGVALSTASLPILAKLVVEKKHNELGENLETSIKWSVILAVGSMAGIFAFRELLVSLFYEHGKFTRQDTLNTAQVLVTYAIGLVAFNVVKVVTSAFYAFESIWIPSLVSVVAIGLNYAMNSILVTRFGVEGLALTTSLVSIFNAFVLMFVLHWKFKLKLFTRGLVKTLLVTLSVGSLGVFISRYAFDVNLFLLNFKDSSLEKKWLGVLLSLGVFVVFGFVFLFLLTFFIQEARDLSFKLRKRLKIS
jgi:putative peptidoglycan lipid II flippase